MHFERSDSQQRAVGRGDSRNQPDPHFLVKHFEHFFARAPFQQSAVHLQALDCFCTSLRWPQIQRRVFRWVVLAGLRKCQDDMLNL